MSLSINEIYEESRARGLENARASFDEVKEDHKKEYPSGYLNKISEVNKKQLDQAKAVSDNYHANRKKIHDELIALNKSIKELENPYSSLERALKIIEKLIGDKTGLIQFEKNVEIIRAQLLEDKNARMYEFDRIDELIKRVESNITIDGAEKSEALSELRRKRASFEK